MRSTTSRDVLRSPDSSLIILVELADELLEDQPPTVVVKAGMPDDFSVLP